MRNHQRFANPAAPMDKSRTTYVFAAAGLLFWGLLATVAVQDFWRDGGTTVWQPILWETSSAISCTILLLTQRHFTRRWDHLIATPSRWFLRQLIWLPITCAAFVPMAFGMRHAVYALLGETYRHRDWLSTFVYESIKVSLFFGMFMVILFGVLSYWQLMQEKLRAQQAGDLLRQAQLQQLSQQMQPHFLFNALNTISSLIHADPDRADDLLVQLSDVLRATLDLGGQHQAPLSAELQLLRGYARLMAERFSDRVAIVWDIDERTLACQVPVMCLQPLLENVFKHTVERRRELATITISARRVDGALSLCVQDDLGALGTGSSGSGIGLSNLRQRLDVMYGQAASLELQALAPAGVCATLRLPCAC